MTSGWKPSVSGRRSKLERARDEIIALIATGWSDADLCAKYGVQRDSLSKFKARHREETDAQTAIVWQKASETVISDKLVRIAELQWWYDKTKAEAEEYGLTIVEEVETEAKGVTTIVKTRDYRATMVREARGILRQVAEEMDQLPKATNVDLSDKRTYVLQLVKNDGTVTQLG